MTLSNAFANTHAEPCDSTSGYVFGDSTPDGYHRPKDRTSGSNASDVGRAVFERFVKSLEQQQIEAREGKED
jgi:hypothetical protein